MFQYFDLLWVTVIKTLQNQFLFNLLKLSNSGKSSCRYLAVDIYLDK